MVFASTLFTLSNNFKFFTMEQYYYIYVLHSLRDGKNYTGYTKNLKLRFEQHCGGKVESTKNRRPLALIYFEGCLNQQDATHREKYLKTHYGKMYLKNRLKQWYEESSNLI
jgi:putative endonuclease